MTTGLAASGRTVEEPGGTGEKTTRHVFGSAAEAISEYAKEGCSETLERWFVRSQTFP